MPDTAARRLNRIVLMVAELSRLHRNGRDGDGVSFQELGERFGVHSRTVQDDVRVLTALGDRVAADWLLSFGIMQEGDRLSIRSSGAFRRPLRLTPEEMLVLRIALATVEGGEGLLRKIMDGRMGQVPAESDLRIRVVDEHVATSHLGPLLDAAREQRACEIRYSSDDHDETVRVIHPHQIVHYLQWTYVVAWCTRSSGWRRFRAERILEIRPLDDNFERRADFTPVAGPADLFTEPDSGADDVVVRFGAGIAPWVRERYPECEDGPDGTVTVTFRTASVDWLVRHVLQYGDQAEVLGPERYRDAMGRAVRN